METYRLAEDKAFSSHSFSLFARSLSFAHYQVETFRLAEDKAFQQAQKERVLAIERVRDEQLS